MAIYKDFNIQPENSLVSSDVVTNVKDTVSSGMWADGAGSITTFFTSSAQSASSAVYYLDVYSKNPQSDSTAKPQFSVAYGHFNGSGSAGAVGTDGLRASATIYRQLANTLLGPSEEKFTFAGSGANVTPEYIYAISVARQQLREKMDPGNWEIHISGSGANKYKFIDDSAATTNPTVNQGGRVFNVVSGSIASGTAVTLGFHVKSTGSVEFFVNRALVATHTTNIPDDENLALGAMQLSGSATGTKSMNVDYIFAAQTR